MTGCWRCAWPVQFKGESFRKRTAQEKLGRMQKRVKEEMR